MAKPAGSVIIFIYIYKYSIYIYKTQNNEELVGKSESSKNRRENRQREKNPDHNWTATQQVSTVMEPNPTNKQNALWEPEGKQFN